MKKIILLALAALIMVGCIEVEKDSNGHIAVNTGADISIIDSCEYVACGYGLAHKGNCRFCKERDSIKWEKRRKELEELVIILKEE